MTNPRIEFSSDDATAIRSSCGQAAQLVIDNLTFTGHARHDYVVVVTVLHRPSGITASACSEPSLRSTAVLMQDPGKGGGS